MNKPTVERMRQELSANERKKNLDRFLKDSVVKSRLAKGGLIHLAIGGQGPRNWLKGSVDPVIRPLMPNGPTHRDEALMLGGDWTEHADTPEGQRQMSHNEAIGNWVKSNLGNYIKKQMATHDDPIRKLAEQGILHIDPEQVGLNRYKAADRRRQLGEEQLGQSEEAKAWEDATDVAFNRTNVGNIMAHPDAKKRNGEPWMEKADPKTFLYYPSDNMHAHYLGFDHMVDVLKQDLAEGKIRPEQLNKMSIEQAVRRVHQYDQERKKAMAQASLQATEGMPVHKEYPEGYRWIEIKPKTPDVNEPLPKGYEWLEPKNGMERLKGPSILSDKGRVYIGDTKQEALEAAHKRDAKLSEMHESPVREALKYEGDTMGHCVGGEGYIDGVMNGSKRIFSLRDAKNEPHVTIEVRPKVERNQHLIHEQLTKKLGRNPTQEEFLAEIDNVPPAIEQIYGKSNKKPKDDYIPYVQDFIKGGKWSDIKTLHNAELRDMTKTPKLKEWLETNNIPHDRYVTEKEYGKHESDYLANQLGMKASGGVVSKADGGSVKPKLIEDIPNESWLKGKVDYAQQKKAQGGTVQGGNMPTLAEMRAMLMRRGNPIELQSIGVNEAPGMNPKAYLPPDQPQSFQPAPGGVALKTGMPIGGVDQSRNQQGSQLMPQQIQQTDQPQGNMPGQQPNPMPTGFGQSGSTEAPPAPAQGPSGNILSMTPQGRALSAIGPAQKPQGMANGGGVEQQGVTMSSPKSSRLVFQAEGSGGVKGINVPRHMWEGSKTMGGMKDINAARATVYGSENRDPLTIGQIGKIHKQTLDEHFEKPIEQQIADEKAALGRLREAKHIGKTANTLDESEKLDTVRHEHDEEGRTHVGYASKGVAGRALYTSGYGKNMKHHVINTCPGQTEGCGGGKDANGIVNTTKGTCFAPVAESQYPGAAIRRASHEQAKHDPAMTRDWILAHTGSIREAANKADKNNQRMLFRPNVVDETDTSSRHVIRHLNEQRKQEDKPGIIANSYGKTNELHDPENGYYVTHSNVGPKVKKGQEITENIGRDRARVRNTIMAADNRGDFTNEQGNKTPPKGSYMVTDVKRGSPLSKKMEENITHAKYWTTGREERKLSDAEKEEGPEGHYGPDGKPTTPEKAHYGHTTINGRRYDYQKQHILHPRLVQVGENKDGTPHMIPTDSRFKDTDFLPKNRFKTKNGKDAGHILMTTPTESTSNLAHDTSFTHHVNESHIKHAMNNNGEYEIDKPEDQEKARGKEYAAPQPINIVKKAMGGIIESRHSGLSDDDFHAFPERNLAAQRHLAKRHGDDEDRPKKRYKGVVVHKNTNTMRHEMMMRRKG